MSMESNFRAGLTKHLDLQRPLDETEGRGDLYQLVIVQAGEVNV